MKINRDNYEAYFLDYYEGQLSQDSRKEVLFFVELNPDLKNIFEEFETVTLIADQDIVFEKKSSLKKNHTSTPLQVNELNIEEYLLHETEGLLTAGQIAAIEEFISRNLQFERDRKLFALSHLTVEDEIVFEGNSSLKQKAIPVGEITDETIETYLARELEGDLNPFEKLLLAEFMHYNPLYEKDRKLLLHTILNVDYSIAFENKNSLKQAAVIPIRRLIYYSLSAAASLAILFSVYFLLERNNIPRNIVQQNKVQSTVGKAITEPTTEMPGKQVAANNIDPTRDVAAHNQNEIRSSSSESDHTVNSSITLEPLATIDRHAIEPLTTRPAEYISTRSYVDPEFTFIRVSQMYQNQNIEFYYNLKLAEDIEYAEQISKDQKPARKLFNAITGRDDAMVAQNSPPKTEADRKNATLWSLAEAGVHTFNKITSGDLELNLRKNNEGKVVGYDLQGNLINIDKQFKK